MDPGLFIFILALVAYTPLAVLLLYVWWKYGKGEPGVSIARSIFLTGSALLIAYMMII